MNVKFVCASTLASLLLFSCNSENEDLYPESESNGTGDLPTSFKISPDEAQNIVLDFMNGLSSSSTRGFAESREISNVKALRRSSLETRAAEELSIDLDTLMYVVNFSNDLGYAFVSADRRSEPIFAFVENGNFSFDSTFTEKDEPLVDFLDRAIYTEIEDINNYVPRNVETRATTSKGWTINSTCGPLLKTRWSQGSKNPNSFGKYCPNYTTGCTVTATAQILSHFKTLTSVSWKSGNKSGSATLHWNTIVSDSESNGGMLYADLNPQSMEEVAQLCRYLGACFDADYKSSGSTSVSENKPIKWFNDRKTLKATDLKSYNETAIINAIKAGNPVYARGNSHKKKILFVTTYSGGHAWVYDGYVSASKSGKTQNLIHCNWGWGGSGNGFYASKVFNTNVGPDVYDSEVTRGTDYHYQYNLEYSIISRR